MATSEGHSGRNRPGLPDPDFYTDLWGSKRRTARARPGDGRRGEERRLGRRPELLDLRRHAALVALVAGALLLGQLALGLVAGGGSGGAGPEVAPIEIGTSQAGRPHRTATVEARLDTEPGADDAAAVRATTD